MQSATDASTSQPPPSVSATTAVTTTAVVTATARSPVEAASPVWRSRRALAALVLAAIGGGVALVATRSSDATQPVAGAPHVVASEVRPLSGELRSRDVASGTPGDLAGEASATASARAGHAGQRPPRATSDEPGKKPPRPNPYASSSPPR